MSIGTWIVASLARREGELPSTAHALFERMSEPVWWIDHPRSWKDVARDPREWGAWPRVGATGTAMRWIVPPPAPVHAIPDAWFDVLTDMHARRVARWLVPRLANAPRPHVLWNAFDVAWGTLLARHLPHDLLVYHAYDDLASARHVARHGVRYEPELLARADLDVATSPALFATHRNHPGARWVPNGVDFEAFARASALGVGRDTGRSGAGGSRGEDPLRDWPRPRVGYLGHLEDRLDVALLLEAARARPDWSWVLVGPVHPACRERFAPLMAQPNVAWLGARPPAQTPRFLAALDVGLLPFVASPQTRSVYPLKLHEYLAAGLPVVATPFADLPGAEEVVCRVRNGNLVEAVERALGTCDEASRSRRQAIARQADWQVRVRQVRALVEEALAGRHAGLPGGAP